MSLKSSLIILIQNMYSELKLSVVDQQNDNVIKQNSVIHYFFHIWLNTRKSEKKKNRINKAVEFDQIRSRDINYISHSHVKPVLNQLYNCIFSRDLIPRKVKIAVVKPIYKKVRKSNCLIIYQCVYFRYWII